MQYKFISSKVYMFYCLIKKSVHVVVFRVVTQAG
jgi:hypothetical protein